MNRYVKGAVLGLGLMLALPMSTWAMTGGELKASFPSEYTAGKRSVYGPSLTQTQLDALAQVISDFVNGNITADMNEEQKIREIHNYLYANVSYAESWSENSANTAYGALINHMAQCSGYARAFKAMCDAVGIECYYVHADEHAINPSHQWNIVKYEGQYYYMDVQLNCTGIGDDAIYLSAEHPCTYNTAAYPQVASTDAPVQRYHFGQGPYAKAAEPVTVADSSWTESFRAKIVPEAEVEVEELDYGICKVIRLPEITAAVYVEPDCAYDESQYDLMMAVIPYKGAESRAMGGLVVAQEYLYEGAFFDDFRPVRKGMETSIDPLGQGRSGPEIARFCRENDIFFELAFFDDHAYQKLEQQQGYITLEDLVCDVAKMRIWMTY